VVQGLDDLDREGDLSGAAMEVAGQQLQVVQHLVDDPASVLQLGLPVTRLDGIPVDLVTR
jgi:hypothetical protein